MIVENRSASVPSPDPNAAIAISKVAKITLAFWIMKICATTVGETGGDMLSMTLNVGYAVSSLILIGFFVATLIAQLRSDTFRPFLYWAVILSTSTAGTTMSDFIDRTLGLGYGTGVTILASILVLVLTSWRISVGSLSVDHVRARKVEIFYWVAILASNTLGTALGDYLADSSGLGYGLSNLMISAVLATIAAAYFFTPLSRTLLFWAAFVLTRPLGATLGDFIDKPRAQGGLELSRLWASLALLVFLVLCVAMFPQRAASSDDAA